MKRSKRSTIFSKMLFGISIPVIIVFIIAGFLIAAQVGNNVVSQSKTNLESTSSAAANQVDTFFSKYLSGTKNAAANYQIEDFLKKVTGSSRYPEFDEFPNVKTTLDKLAATDSTNILAAWAADFDTSQVAQSDGFLTPIGWDITARPWYASKDTTEAILTEPYVDASTGNSIISTVCAVFDHNTNTALGAIGFDIQLTQLESIMQHYKIGEEGFLILAAKSGVILYDPNKDNIQKNIADINVSQNLKNAFTNQITGNIDYTINDVEYSGAICPVGNTGWLVLSAIPQSEMMKEYYYIIKVIAFIFIIGTLLLIVMIYMIAKGISNPLKSLSVTAEAIAEGNLSVEVNVHTNDEIGLVADALGDTIIRLKNYINYIDEVAAVLNQIADKNLIFQLKYDYAGEFSKVKESILKIKDTLVSTMDKISQTSEQVASGSGNLSSSSQALAQGAAEQASSVEELAATISEILEKTAQNAASSENANNQAAFVSDELTESNKQMSELIDAMSEINKSSNEIGKIIKTIEDIAFQTNILALNAAVEAARAGSAGKGFAVVADEVRNLAAKSSEAAKSTTSMIEASISAVTHGTKLADQAAASLMEVVDSTHSVSTAIGSISEASAQQADALKQVSLGIDQISSVVQTNSATAEESAASSEELSGQAEILKNMVNEFKIN